MEYIILKEITITALCVMGLAITEDCNAETKEECMVCPRKHRCDFVATLMDEIEKGKE